MLQKMTAKQEGRQRSEEVVVVSPAGTVVSHNKRMTRSGLSTEHGGTGHFWFRSSSISQDGVGWAGSLQTQHLSLPSNASQHKEAARLNGEGGRQRKLPDCNSEAWQPGLSESQQVLRSETEGLWKLPDKGNEGFSKNKSENTNPHHSRITYAVSFNILARPNGQPVPR